MKHLMKKVTVMATVMLVSLNLINCPEDKDDNTGLLLAGLILANQNEWSVTMNLTVRKADGGTLRVGGGDDRSVEFTSGVGAPALVLTANERIRALATAGAQAGAGKIVLTWKQSTNSQNMNITLNERRVGGNADLIDDYTLNAGAGHFTLVANDADPTNLNQVQGLVVTGGQITVDSIRVVRRGTYSLPSPTVGENICDGVTSTSPVTKSGTISGNETWSGSILLSGTVTISNNATITVQPGTVVFGQRGSSLFFLSGTKLEAKGTAANPICFTSSQSPGTRAPGDWGGIVLVGGAIGSRSSGTTEGTTPVTYTSGGSDDTGSGNLEYVIVEFAGNEVAPGDELNNLSLYHVGSQTTLSHVQAHRGLDDQFEAWGGKWTGRNLLATGGLDDDFDLDEGYQGTLTNIIGHKYPTACGGTLSSDPRGFEMDGKHSGACTGGTGTGRCTNVTISNVTLIGGETSGAIALQEGMRLREGITASVSSALVWGYPGDSSSRTVRCSNDAGFDNSTCTFTSVRIGASGAASLPTGVTSDLSSLPITSVGGVNATDCGFSASKPDYSTVSSLGSTGGGQSKWWESWAVFRAR